MRKSALVYYLLRCGELAPDAQQRWTAIRMSSCLSTTLITSIPHWCRYSEGNGSMKDIRSYWRGEAQCILRYYIVLLDLLHRDHHPRSVLHLIYLAALSTMNRQYCSSCTAALQIVPSHASVKQWRIQTSLVAVFCAWYIVYCHIVLYVLLYYSQLS